MTEIKWSADKRIPELDGLRGLAILLVMLFHFLYFPLMYGVKFGSSPAMTWITRMLLSGWIGVDLFFVLSGFLITGILRASRGQEHFFRNFYIRRTLRIFPLYFLVLALWIWLKDIYPAMFVQRATPGYEAYLWTYTSNMLMANSGWDSVPTPLDHLWTLAIEEQFYLFWPLVIYFTSEKTFLRTCLGLIAGALILRIALHFSAMPLAAYMWTPSRIDAFAFGALMTLPAAKKYARHLLIAGFALTTVLFVFYSGLASENSGVLTLGLTSFAAASAGAIGVLLPFNHNGLLVRLLKSLPIRALGKYSYGLYILHQPLVIWLLPNYLFQNIPVAARLNPGLLLAFLLVVPLIASLVLAAAVYSLWERPFLIWKQKFSST